MGRNLGRDFGKDHLRQALFHKGAQFGVGRDLGRTPGTVRADVRQARFIGR